MHTNMLTKTLLAVTGLSLSLLAQNKDIVERTDAKPLRTTILRLELDKLYYKKGKDAEGDLPWSRVRRFKLADAGDEYTRAESAARRGDHKMAGQLFTEAAAKATRPVVKACAQFYAGRALTTAAERNKGLASAAIAALEAYLGENATGYFAPEARIALGINTMRKGDAKAAADILDKCLSDATAQAWRLRWHALARFHKGKALHAAGDFSNARSELQSVANAVQAALGEDNTRPAELEAARAEALMLVGETYIGEKLFAEALRYYRGLTSGNTPGVKAAAFAGEGQILYMQAEADNDANKLREAQLALANANIEPDTTPLTSAKALYYMGMVLKALGDKEENSAARAKAYFRSVISAYANTPWAQKARQARDS